MRIDELRSVNPAARVFAITGANERRDEFAHLKMEMGEIAAVGAADSRDFLAAFHRFARMHQHILHMPVVRLHTFAFAVFEIGVEQDNGVAPAWSAVAREQDPAIGDCLNRIAQVAVFSANAV